MFRALVILSSFITVVGCLSAAVVPDKVLICGVCKNIEKAVPNTIRSATQLGSQFSDYRVIIYENNSQDKTKQLLSEWAKTDKHIILISEDLPKKKIASECAMQKCNRTEAIARARNKVLNIAMHDRYADYKYIVWADLDFTDPWDIDNLVQTVLHPEMEWDAVFANGAYDLFAYRDEQFPIGFELIGDKYWKQLAELRREFSIDPQGPWKKVYSAFGGLGIYKRDALKGCRYSGVVTKDLETVMVEWLKRASEKKEICFLKEYEQLLTDAQVIDLKEDRIKHRKQLPDELGVRLLNANGSGKVIWFSCTRKKRLPWTCEHIPLHASMIIHGHDKLYVNPRLISNHP